MRKKKSDNCGSWMDTYGDMVTLLLCFFVLLYAISAIDQTKWANLVRSFNPDAVEQIEQKISDPPDKEIDNELDPEDLPQDFETLYENLRKEITEKNLQSEIEVKKGNGFTFISFKDNIFFDGDSYVLKDQGKVILDDFMTVLSPYADEIKVVEVLGHTADVPERRSAVNDRFLSSNRATAVVVYMQEKDVVDPSRLISMGYGHYWPVDDNSTTEGRAANRRVEVLITKKGSDDRSLDEFYSEIQASEEADAAKGVETPTDGLDVPVYESGPQVDDPAAAPGGTEN